MRFFISLCCKKLFCEVLENMMNDEQSQAGQSMTSISMQSSHYSASHNLEKSPRRQQREQEILQTQKKKRFSVKTLNIVILVILLVTITAVSVKVSKNLNKEEEIFGEYRPGTLSTTGETGTSDTVSNPDESENVGEVSNNDAIIDFNETENFEIIPGVNSGGTEQNPFSDTGKVVTNSPSLSTNAPTVATNSPTRVSVTSDLNDATSEVVVNSSSSPTASPTEYPTIRTTTYFPSEYFTPQPTKCWNWRIVDKDIDGKNIEEQTGGSVSLSSNGRHVAIGGIDVVRTYMERASGWEMTQEANDEFKNVQVALSGDGLRLLIGSPLTDRNANIGVNGDGEVRAFQYSTTVKWFPLGQTLYGNQFDQNFGNSIDISFTGSKIIIGSQASVRVYQLAQETTINGLVARWEVIRHIIKIVPDETYGSSVAISANGNRIAVGEPKSDNDNRGSVSIFNLEPYRLMLKVDGARYEDRLGKSVSLSADGNRFVAGAYFGDYVQAYEYIEAEQAWALMGFKIYGEDSDSFGRVVDMSNDGTRIAIGAPNDSTGGEFKGMAQVFEFIDGDWQQLGNNVYGEYAYDYSAWSISLSGDGRRLAVGADFNDGGGYKTGQTRVYEYYCIE